MNGNAVSRAQGLLRRLDRQGVSVSVTQDAEGLSIAAPRSLPEAERLSLQSRALRALEPFMPAVLEVLRARESVSSDFDLPWPDEFSERLARRLWERLDAFVNGPQPSSPEYREEMRAFHEKHGPRRFTQEGSLILGGWRFPHPDDSSAVSRLGDYWNQASRGAHAPGG